MSSGYMANENELAPLGNLIVNIIYINMILHNYLEDRSHFLKRISGRWKPKRYSGVETEMLSMSWFSYMSPERTLPAIKIGGARLGNEQESWKMNIIKIFLFK